MNTGTPGEKKKPKRGNKDRSILVFVSDVLAAQSLICGSTCLSASGRLSVCIDKPRYKRCIDEATSGPAGSLGISFVKPVSAERLAVCCLIVLLKI